MKLSISSPEMMDQHAKQAVILVAIATLFAEGVVSEGSNITLKSRGTPMEAALSLVNNMVAIFRNQIMNQSNSSYAALSNLPKIFGSLNLTTIAQQLEDTDLVKKIISTFPNGKVNQNCFRDTIYTLTSIITLKKWALNMFDATGKIESGIQKGHFYFIGSFDQCYGAEPKMQTFHSEAGGLTKTRTFGTRFCRADISIPDSLVKGLNVDTRGVKLKLTWGLCVPDSCKSTDVDGMLNSGSMFNISLPIEKVFCYEEEALSSDTSAIVATCILSLFALLITCGTLIDAYRAYFELGHITSTNNINLSTSRDLPSGKSTKLMEANGKTWMNNTSSNDNSEPLPLEHNENIKNKKMNDDGYVEKTELEIALPAGYVAHRETQIQINRSDTAIVNSAIQQSTPGRTSTLIKSQQDKMVVRLLLCFSVYTNIPKILNAKVSSGSVACIHGIRFFSLTWVVLGHTYNYGIISMEETLNAANLLDFVGILQRFTYQTVVAGGFAVDTFFVLSAFLLTWLHLKDKAKEEKKCTLWASVYFYFHRFWRLTPIYMFVMMAFACLYKYLGSGPMWPSSITTAENCKQYWWTNLLYINNLVHVDNQCMGWSWYLANDMQFYVISPVFLLAMIMSPIYGAVLTCILLAVGIACAFWKEYIYNGNFFTMKEDGGDYWREVYIVPWCRVGCWAVGMLLGLLVFHRDGKPLRNKIIIRLGWLLATAVALFLVYIPYTEQKKDGEEWTRVHRAFYEGFGRPAWGVCIAWVIFACLSGKGGIVNTILSWNGFIPLSRLTYSAYLVHPICMMVNIWSRRTLLYVSDYTIIYLFLGHLCMTYMVSFVCSLAFEAPFMALEKLLFRRERRS